MFTYKFSKATGEYMYAEKALLDPMETMQYVPMRKPEFDADGNELPIYDDRIERLHEAAQKVYLLPADSTFEIPPYAKEGYAAKWNGKAWELVEDHRQKQGIGGTPYWMPGDTWQTPARYMSELGKLPEGAILKAPEKPAEVVAEEELAKAKGERAAAVAAITVEVDGMVFDGDETAQERMARTVTAATATGAPMDGTTVWVLHDNTVATPTIRQLATALRMAGEAQTALWTKPYES